MDESSKNSVSVESLLLYSSVSRFGLTEFSCLTRWSVVKLTSVSVESSSEVMVSMPVPGLGFAVLPY